MMDQFLIYDMVGANGLRSKHLTADNGPRIAIGEVPRPAEAQRVDMEILQLRIGRGPAAHITRTQGAAIIDILAKWLATGRVWLEAEEE